MMKGIIFDFDGTLVDSEKTHYLAWHMAFKEHNYLLEHGFHSDNFAGLGDKEVSLRAEQLVGYACSDKILERKNYWFDQYIETYLEPIEAAIVFAQEAFEKGVKIGIASGAQKWEIMRALKLFEIEHFFNPILSGFDDLEEYSDPEGTNKPKPYVYLKAAKMMGLKPEECVAIEDSWTGVTAAVGAGCHTVAIPNHFTQNHDLSAAQYRLPTLAHCTVEDLLSLKLPRSAPPPHGDPGCRSDGNRN